MKKSLLLALIAACGAAPSFAASTDTFRTSPTGSGIHRSTAVPSGFGIGASTGPISNTNTLPGRAGTIPGSAFPSWTEMKGEVVGVNGNTVQFRQAGDTTTQNVDITGNVTVYDSNMKPVRVKSLKPGQSITLQNSSTATPAPQPAQSR